MDQASVWRCPNLDCPAQIRARIEHWCSPAAMDIAGGDAALVVKLIGQGLVRDVAELYRLKVGEIAAIEGMGRNSARKFFDAITTSRKREAWRLMQADDFLLAAKPDGHPGCPIAGPVGQRQQHHAQNEIALAGCFHPPTAGRALI